LHRCVSLGVAGFVLTALTGVCFLAGTPDQFFYNDAFGVKMLLLLIAALNVCFFYTRLFPALAVTTSMQPASRGARVAAGVSLFSWIGIVTAGRLITFFRPPWG
jgi:hypothetical protein